MIYSNVTFNKFMCQFNGIKSIKLGKSYEQKVKNKLALRLERSAVFFSKIQKKNCFDILIPFEMILSGNIYFFRNSYWKCLNLRKCPNLRNHQYVNSKSYYIILYGQQHIMLYLAQFCSGTLQDSVFLYLKLLLEFVFASRFSAKSGGKNCFNSAKYQMKFIMNPSNIPYYFEQFFVSYVSAHLLFAHIY